MMFDIMNQYWYSFSNYKEANINKERYKMIRKIIPCIQNDIKK